MTKYSQYHRSSSRDKNANEKIHPIWRGVGFIFMILAPVMGYFGSLMLIEANKQNKWVIIPREFLASGSDPMLYVKIGLTILLALLIFFILQFIGMIILRMAGPERYGPLDVPPITGVKKKRAR
ncbi:MAG: hypothetical protein ACYC6H_05000 [Bellilinea sp.]